MKETGMRFGSGMGWVQEIARWALGGRREGQRRVYMGAGPRASK
jgi:hypothetical protein